MRHNLNPLVRPSISTNEIPPKIIKKRSILLPTLLSVCAYFIILIAICIGALVLVGKNMSLFDSSTSDKQYRTSKNLDDFDNHFMTKSAVNKIKFYNKHRDNSEVTSFTLLSTKSIDLNTNKNMSFSKVIEQLNFRLPATIRPTLYNLYLHPDLKTKTFSGNVKIHLEITKPTNFIPVHIKFLNITKTDLFKKNPNGNSSLIEIKQSFEYQKFEYWVTETVNNLEVGDYILDLNFTGSLANRIVGFYQSSYFDKKKNESRVIATSKFEPTYARQAFPCFDEPALKAPYEVRLVRPTGDGYISLSNMPVLSETVIEGTTNTLTTFEKSVAMSTYLTVFVVCDFERKTERITPANPDDSFDMSVYATSEQLEKTTYALATGKKVIEYYIDYFGIKYPLPKLDMAAIPDFVSGAMETWGLVTYRETSLLYDPAVSSTVNKQRVVSVIAHELAHMWFGNLVTMNWWNDLWLNEGFASYIEYKGTHAAEPDWNVMDQFIIDDLHPVLTVDATVASHPIVLTVSNPDQITAIFDTITYSKGSSLIRMLEDFVGENVFKTSVTAYLEKHKESTAVTDDLLEELEALNTDERIDIRQVMSTWTNQKGFPVINVVKTDTGYTLTQKRFISNPEKENSETEASEFNYRWTVPITYITDVENTVQRSWFHHDDTQHDLKLDTMPTWIKINNQQIGYYRVNYDNENWKALTSALISDVDSLTVSDRSHLLNDAFNLADATHLSYDIAMDLTKYLEKETQHVPWATMSSKLISIKNLLYRRDASDKYLQYATELVKSAYGLVDWEVNEAEHSKNHLRITVLGLACSLGLPECIKEVQDKFTEWLALADFATNRPHPDLRSIIYSYGMANAGSEELWEKVYALFVAEQDATEKIKLMASLTSVKNIEKLDKLIKVAATETNIIKGQDYFTVLQSIAANRYGEDLVWNYVRENWDKLVDRFTLNERTLGRMIPSITARFTTKIRLTEMEKFFEDNPEAGAGEAARGEALENVSYNIKWLENNEKAIEEWLDSNNV